MDNKLAGQPKAGESSAGGDHGHSQAEMATKRLLDEAVTKFHTVNNGGSHIESVKETKGGYDVSVAQGSHHETLKIGREQVGSALTLDLTGPGLYKTIHDPEVAGQRTLTMVGGTMKGVYDAAAKEWTHNPGKAITDGATSLIAAAGLTVAAEAAPVLTSVFGASAIGFGSAEAVVHYPEFAQKAGRLNQVWNQAGHVDANTSITQAKEVGGLLGEDAFHLGTAALTTLMGCKAGFKLRPEVSGNLEAAAVTAATQFGKSLMTALSEVPKTFEGAFSPSGMKLAFATAVADTRLPFEAPAQPGILKMGAYNAGARDSSLHGTSNGEDALAAKGAATQLAVKLDDATLAAIRKAETPQEAFAGEEGWRQVKAAKIIGAVYRRETESLVNGQPAHTIEHFVPHKLLAMTYKSATQDYEVIYDLARGVETTTDNLARQLLGQPATRLKLNVQELPPLAPVAPSVLPGEGKAIPNSKWLPAHKPR